MNSYVYRAPPISWDSIAEITGTIRDNLGLGQVKFFLIIEVLEQILDQRLGIVRIEVEDDIVMGDAEGFTDPGGEYIRFSEQVYRQAYLQRPRARWTAAHETGHFFLHTRKPLTRLTTAASIQAMKPFECPERQAHQFAAELLMPRGFLNVDTPLNEIMRDFGVSEEAAKKRIKFISSLT
jgi:Zn-dependent peptidase ImmA (M78 family)